MSHHYPPAPQPGHGPPPVPGFGPPPMPPKKSGTGLILGLVIGIVVLLGLAGGAVWFFLGGGPAGTGGGKTQAFPAEYDPVAEAVAAGTQFNLTKPESYDICVELEMAALKKMLPFEGNPDGVTETNESGHGVVSCSGTMRGKIEVDNNNPTGSLTVGFEVMKDPAAVEETFGVMWEKYSRYTKPIDGVKIGEAAEAKYRDENNVIDVVVVFRNGNMLGTVMLGMNHGRYFEPPDKQMMVNLMTDIANSGMTALSE